jgi:hypothetical protein
MRPARAAFLLLFVTTWAEYPRQVKGSNAISTIAFNQLIGRGKHRSLRPRSTAAIWTRTPKDTLDQV